MSFELKYLKYKEKYLHLKKQLGRFNIIGGGLITIFINVLGDHSKQEIITIDQNAKVEDLKKILKERKAYFNDSHWELIYGGNVLDNDKTLLSYNIQQETELRVIFKLLNCTDSNCKHYK